MASDLLKRVRLGPPVGLAVITTGLLWRRARARARDRAAQEERDAQWAADAPERLRRQEESAERDRQRRAREENELLAAAEAKGWRYEDVGQCHLEKRKKRFATELDAQIFTWLQRKKHGGELQRAYPCDGSDAGDGSGCGSWHLTSKAAFS